MAKAIVPIGYSRLFVKAYLIAPTSDCFDSYVANFIGWSENMALPRQILTP